MSVVDRLDAEHAGAAPQLGGADGGLGGKVPALHAPCYRQGRIARGDGTKQLGPAPLVDRRAAETERDYVGRLYKMAE